MRRITIDISDNDFVTVNYAKYNEAKITQHTEKDRELVLRLLADLIGMEQTDKKISKLKFFRRKA